MEVIEKVTQGLRRFFAKNLPFIVWFTFPKSDLQVPIVTDLKFNLDFELSQYNLQSRVILTKLSFLILVIFDMIFHLQIIAMANRVVRYELILNRHHETFIDPLHYSLY